MRFLLSFLIFIATPAWAADAWEAFFDPFLGELRAELDEAKRTGQGALVMYHFEACPYCARLKREVLSRADVQQAYRADFVALAIDTRGSPTFDFYGVDGERLYRRAGGLYDPAEFLLLGRYVASGAHRSLTFAEYKHRQKGT